MNRYRINSVHSVYEDSYTEGEGRFVNEWDQKSTVSAESVQDAIKEYYKKELYMEYKPEDTETDENRLYDSRMVDENNYTPSESQIESWKKGELTLYAENITLYIYKLEPVDLSEL
jgi:hypothetical protein